MTAALDGVRACIGLGANLGQPALALRHAADALAALPETRLLALSRFYRTPAWGRVDQPDFINAAALVHTRLAPEVLLESLLRIEREAGRERAADSRWGPRVLDLDLLLYAGRVIDQPGLQVPHPYMHERAFVLVPLAEIAPDLAIPGHGRVRDAVMRVDACGIAPIG